MNLILAALWFILAAALYVTGRGQPEETVLPIRLDVLALLLALYNVLRWWGVRASRQKYKQSASRSRRPLRRPGDEAEPDPNFLFDEPPDNDAGERGVDTPR